MNIDLYERIWMWLAGVIVVGFLTFVGATTFAEGIRPPSHVETIDPAKVFQDPRFSRVGVPTELADGTIEVQVITMMFAFVPNEIRVPPGRRIRFRLTSGDVTHGFIIAGTNANTMVVPGYIAQFTTTFDTPGDYLLMCHEFCGTGHHAMHGRVVVDSEAPVVKDTASAGHAGEHQ
jgi:cytochrome c oxidase subunit II